MFQFYFCTHGDFKTLLGAFFTFDAMQYAFAKPSRVSFSFGKRFRAVERIEKKSPRRECGEIIQKGMIKTNIIWRHCNNKTRERAIMGTLAMRVQAETVWRVVVSLSVCNTVDLSRVWCKRRGCDNKALPGFVFIAIGATMDL